MRRIFIYGRMPYYLFFSNFTLNYYANKAVCKQEIYFIFNTYLENNLGIIIILYIT